MDAEVCMMQRSSRSFLMAVCVALSIAGILPAQSIAPPKYKFEEASIKPSKEGSERMRISPGPNGGLQMDNVTTMALLTNAFNCRPFQIVNAPGWVNVDRFNITGTPDQPEQAPSPNLKRAAMEEMFGRQQQRMLALLIERFSMVARTETREMPIYALVVAKGGSKLVKAGEGQASMWMRPGHIKATSGSMKQLSNLLSNLLGRPVVDETGLAGEYDLEFEWTPDTAVSEDGPPGDHGPSIFTAIREKLGLRLESKKGPAPVFVIEKIEKPSEN